MKKDSSSKNGFTLLEVLISLVILSIITIITSSFLQSSIKSKEIIFNKSAEIFQINLLADALREDIINAINIPLLDSRGEPENKTFQSASNANSFKFVTKIRAGKNFSSEIAQVKYLLDGDKFLRRQFYAAAPSNPMDFAETVMLNKVQDIKLEFSDGKTWTYFWPAGQLNQKKFPLLIKVVLDLENDKTFTWIIHSDT